MAYYLTIFLMGSAIALAPAAAAQSAQDALEPESFPIQFNSEDPPGELPLSAPVVGVETLDLGEVGSLPPLPPAIKEAVTETAEIASIAPAPEAESKPRPLTVYQLKHLEEIARTQEARQL